MPKKYETVIKKLIDKSEAGALPWKPTFNENTFILALEGEVSFEVAQLEFGGFQFLMKDSDGKKVVDIIAHNRRQFQDDEYVDDDAYFADLSRLYEAARVIALQVNEKLTVAESLLDHF